MKALTLVYSTMYINAMVSFPINTICLVLSWPHDFGMRTVIATNNTKHPNNTKKSIL